MQISDTELEAALAVIAPEIQGLESIANDQLSDPLLTEVQIELSNRQRRKTLLDTTLAAMQALEADGYPAPLPPVPMDTALLAELNADVSNVQIGAAVFVPAIQATTMRVTMGPFTDSKKE